MEHEAAVDTSSDMCECPQPCLRFKIICPVCEVTNGSECEKVEVYYKSMGSRGVLEVPLSLQIVAVDESMMMAEIPCFSVLPSLVRLTLEKLFVVEFPSFAPLLSLVELHITALSLLRHFPLEIADAPKLEVLMVRSCEALVKIPPELFLRLSKVTETQPDASRFKCLLLADLNCEFPRRYEALPGLQNLWLEHSKLRVHADEKSRIPSPRAYMPSLNELTVIGFEFMSKLTAYGNIQNLVMENIIGSVKDMPSLAPLRKLKTLEINGSRMHNLPDGIGDAPMLSSLTIGDCPELICISKELIRRLADPTQENPLRFKALHLSDMKCAIPDEIGTLLGLEELALINSQRTVNYAPFPRIGERLTALRVLIVMGYKEYHELPRNMSALTSLTTLKIKDGNMCIPRAIKQLTSLKHFILRNNDLREIPIEVGFLANLEVFKCRECSVMTKIDPLLFINCKKITKFQISLTDRAIKSPPKMDVNSAFADMVSSMHNMESLRIQLRPGYCKKIFSALRSWPPAKLTEIWLSFSLCGSLRNELGNVMDHNELSRHNLNIVKGWQNTQDKLAAFILGTHSRLGAKSGIKLLDGLVLTMIGDIVMCRKGHGVTAA